MGVLPLMLSIIHILEASKTQNDNSTHRAWRQALELKAWMVTVGTQIGEMSHTLELKELLG